VGGLLLLPFSALAVDPAKLDKHSDTNGIACITCHASHRDNLSGSTLYNNACLSCHRPGDAKGGTKPLGLADAANPLQFKGYTAATPKPAYQTSHRWDGFLSATSAGAKPPLNAALAAKVAATGNRLACVVCHDQHDNTNGSFLRIANGNDELCVDCHRDRNKQSHVGGSHPVLINYSAFTAPHSGKFRKSPLNAYSANQTSALRFKNQQVVCSTCHGMHYADSRSSTIDSGAAYANLSSGDGNLLRTDRRGTVINPKTGDALNICSNCHADKFTHNGRNQNIQCTNCHSAHAVTGTSSPTATNNVYLVRREMQGAALMTLYTSTTNKNFADANGTGVCQSCHSIPTPADNPGYPEEHNGYTGCESCHNHYTPLAGGGSFGLKGGCTTCHGYPPEAKSAGGPNGYAVHQGVSPFTDEDTAGHFTHADKTRYAKRCIECHKGNQHNSGTFTDVFNSAGPLLSNFTAAAKGGLKAAYSATPMTCSNVYCHSNGQPRGGSLVATTTPSWAQNKGGGLGAITQTTNRCDFCHNGYKATLTTNAHGKHLAVNATCDVCHRLSPADNSFVPYSGNAHVNGKKDVLFSTSGIATGGTWNDTAATCTSLYCHSNGKVSPTTVTSPAWAGGTTACSSCHGDRTSTGGTLSLRHYAHLNYTSAVGRPLHCTTCHAATAANDSSVVTDARYHTNGKVNVRFDTRFNPDSRAPAYVTDTTVAGGAAVNASATGAACVNTYCHSGGKDNNASSPLWTTGAAIGCNGCHGDLGAAGGKAHPIYTLSPNSHVQHVESSNYGCDYCHINTTASTTVPPSSVRYQPFSTHINGRIDVSFKSNGGIFGIYSAASRTCSGTYCHGTKSPVWGTTGALNCASCHSASNSAGSALPGAHGIHYAASVLPTKFRNLSGNVSTAASYRFTCSSCHDATTALHAGGAARASAPYAAAEVYFSSFAAKTGSTTYNYGASQGAPIDRTLQWTNGGDSSCNTTYCHSNGQGGNGSSVNWSTTATSGSCASCHGSAASVGALTAKHGSHFASTMSAVAFSCPTCHAATVSNNATISNKANHVNKVKDVAFGPYSGSNTPNATVGASTCQNTYCHSNGTTTKGAQHPAITWSGSIAANCAGCHGTVTSSGGAGSALSGKHPQHVNNTAVLGLGNNFGCSECHAKTVSSNTVISNSARHLNKLKDYSGARAGQLTGSGQCSNNYCHSSGQATPVFRTVANWNSATTYTCTGCHGQDSGFTSVSGEPNYANGGAGAATANSHQKHVEVIGIVNTTQCADCHAKTVDPAVANKFKDYTGGSYHLNKQRNVVFQLIDGRTGSYDSVNKTCSATYCHGTPATLPQWGNNGSLNCASCHSASNALPGAHAIHYAATQLPDKFINFSGNVSSASTYRFTCTSCHATGIGKTDHARGAANANGVAQVYYGVTTATRKGTAYNYGPAAVNPADNITFTWTDGGSTSCNTSYCHSNGQGGNGAATVTWSMAASGASCDRCHTNGSLSGYHAQHINNSASLGKSFRCAACHRKTVSNNTAIGNKALHVNKFREYSGLTAGRYNGTTCTAVYCHSSGQAAPTYRTVANWKTAGTTYGCTSCHGADNAFTSQFGEPNYANGGAAAASANSHQKHALNAASCYLCHAVTVTTTGFTLVSSASGAHINKQREVNFVTAVTGSNAGYVAGTKTCSNVYCHSNGQVAPASFTSGTVTVQWGGSAPCGSCHKVVPTFKLHSTHSYAAYGPKSACAACHPAETAATHANGVKNLIAGDPGTCSTCHPSGIDVTSSWVTGAPRLSCESCHTGTPSVINGIPAPIKSMTAVTNLHRTVGCSICHDNTSAHISSSLGTYRRLKGAVNNICTSCHSYNSIIVGTSFRIMSSHFTTKGGAANSECTTCHDPHGSSNVHFVRTKIKFGLLSATINYQGGTAELINTTNNRGLCQVCHTQTSHFRNGVAETTHPTSDCLVCHPHKGFGASFRPNSACNGCHGYPPVSKNLALGSQVGVTGNYQHAGYEKYSSSGSAHIIDKHVSKTAVANDAFAPCAKCHDPNSHVMTPLEFKPSSNIKVKINQRYRFETAKQASYTSNRLDGTLHKTGTCSNISCHFGATPAWNEGNKLP
jgi:predicted CxxxxCH...CXXCH cytochrome family protein